MWFLAILAGVSLLAGCAGLPLPLPPSPVGPMEPIPTPAVAITPQVLEVDQRVDLPTGTADRPITWRLMDRDRDRARISAGGVTLVPLRPGGLTLEVSAAGRTGWVHHAVRAKGLTTEVISAIPHRPFGVGGPVVIRDLGAWARVWSGWWQPPGTAVAPPAPPTNPDGTPNLSPPAEPPAPPAATGVDFETRSVLLVDLDHGGAEHGDTVVTHVEGATVHLATPAIRFADEAAAAPVPSVRGHAVTVPALPGEVADVDWAGASARVARQVAPVDGRKATIARYLAVRGGRQLEATFEAYADVDQALGFSDLGDAVIAAWRWR